MKYATGSAFRQALEERIRDINSQQKIPIVRLRKQVAFERFIFTMRRVTGYRDKAIILVPVDSVLRASGLCALGNADFDSPTRKV